MRIYYERHESVTAKVWDGFDWKVKNMLTKHLINIPNNIRLGSTYTIVGVGNPYDGKYTAVYVRFIPGNANRSPSLEVELKKVED